MKKIVIALLVFMFLGGVAFAQEDSLPSSSITPGSSLFFLKRFSENVGTFFTFGEVAKSKRMVKLAEERLSEAKTLAEKGDENSEKAIELYEQQFAKASERVQKSQNAEALARVSEATSKHFAVLEEIAGKVPEQAQESVLRALESSKNGQVSALQKLSEVNPDLAVETGANVAKDIAIQAKMSAKQKRSETFNHEIEHFERVFNSFANVRQDKLELSARFSERMTEVVNELGGVKIEAENAGIEGSDLINNIKDTVINSQLSSLRDVIKENPERAIQIYSQAAENRLQAARQNTNDQSGMFAKESLNDFNKYSEFGQQISIMAKDIHSGDTSVQDLVKQATSNHTQVLQEFRKQLPPEARQEFQQALENSSRVQEQRPSNQLSSQPWARQQTGSAGQEPVLPFPEINKMPERQMNAQQQNRESQFGGQNQQQQQPQLQQRQPLPQSGKQQLQNFSSQDGQNNQQQGFKPQEQLQRGGNQVGQPGGQPVQEQSQFGGQNQQQQQSQPQLQQPQQIQIQPQQQQFQPQEFQSQPQQSQPTGSFQGGGPLPPPPGSMGF